MPEEEREAGPWEFFIAPDFDEAVEVYVDAGAAKRLHRGDPAAWWAVIDYVESDIHSRG